MIFWLNVSLFAIVFVLVERAAGQNPGDTPPSSFPHVYPGKPNGPLSAAWQKYYEVTAPLPNVTFPLPRSFAGNIPVNRPGHPNDTLFFWGFEKKNGSLTVQSSTDPWLIWLQGGPGSSSMAGLVLENGPLRIQADVSMAGNKYSWNNLVDSFWIDQPVGTGFSTADSQGYVLDDDQMADDFLQFLSNLVKVFPSLATRPLYLTGESYAGRWIPYITKALFATNKPPVQLKKIAIGDGTMASWNVFAELPTVSVLETYPQLINYDPQVFKYFEQQERLCGYNVNLTYPQTGGKFASIFLPSAVDPNSPFFFTGPPQAQAQSRTSLSLQKKTYAKYLNSAASTKVKRAVTKREIERERRHNEWKRSLALRPNGTLDTWYGCNLWEEMWDYAVNYTFPWTGGPDTENPYDIPDALNPEPANDTGISLDPTFFNDPRTRTAIHAPTSMNWTEGIWYPFGNTYSNIPPSADPMVFMDALAANASAHGVGIVFYSGNDDSLIPHRGTEVTIQNMTFGGIQGFTKKPSTAWTDDSGTFAGIIHQERGLAYALLQGASHLLPNKKPAASFYLLREFILGNNKAGTVQASGTVVGGENKALAADIMPGQSGIVMGSGNQRTTTYWPSATVAAWNSFLAKETSGVGASKNTESALSSGTRRIVSVSRVVILAVVASPILSLHLFFHS
ncbi:alpha/beta-hydrolase [Rickenella mellea]|uniref:Carboxypeptidase n=1 Tax=Rickenella mellea TaxID=50990 RepID=A0A4Y7Q643_9AGAM|nr:alpha/beta-hydrolase [Rickenella mellea]